jgi:ABC-2 type transport system ATP-binding protein
MPDIIVKVENLRKTFGTVVALDGVSLEVEAGSIFGLLGPNGAGKTTTVKVLTALVRPDSGTARIAGVDVLREPDRARRLIGYIPQEVTVDNYLTADEHLRYYAGLYHLPRGGREARIGELLDLVGLAGARNRRAKDFSGGMKKRLDLICGLLHSPQVVFLDEPSLGLDVQTRQNLWSYIIGLKRSGSTILLCTNYMDEAERLCDVVAIVDRGKVVVTGAPETLRDELRRDIVSIEVAGLDGVRGAGLEILEKAVSGLNAVKATATAGAILKIYVEGNGEALPEIVRTANGLAVPIRSITHSRPGLDEVYLHYTGRAFAP